MEYTNRTAIATGAASGMGLLFAQNWTALGGNIVMCDVNEECLTAVVDEINAKGQGKAIAVLCDVRDYAQVRADGLITKAVADAALLSLEVDRCGLDSLDRRMMRSIIRDLGGKSSIPLTLHSG